MLYDAINLAWTGIAIATIALAVALYGLYRNRK